MIWMRRMRRMSHLEHHPNLSQPISCIDKLDREWQTVTRITHPYTTVQYNTIGQVLCNTTTHITYYTEMYSTITCTLHILYYPQNVLYYTNNVHYCIIPYYTRSVLYSIKYIMTLLYKTPRPIPKNCTVTLQIK